MRYPLSKYHGQGNNFLVGWELPMADHLLGEFASAACDVNFGIGADGCVILSRGRGSAFEARIFNRDGSEALSSGNGLRCASAFLHGRGLSRSDEITLLTGAGEKRYRRLHDTEDGGRYRSNMGPVEFGSDRVPFRPPTRQIEQMAFSVGPVQMQVTALWVGNPQCVCVVEKCPAGADFERWAAAVREALFVEDVNIGFVCREGGRLKLKIWERGVGPTCSSGTGSCAAAVVAIGADWVASPAEVITEGGSQVVEWKPGGDVFLTGTATFVADIEFYLQFESE